MHHEKIDSIKQLITQMNHLNDSEHLTKLSTDRVMASFLEIDENKNLLMATLSLPTKKNILELDKAFKKYFTEIRFIKYISMILYYEAIHFNQKRTEQQQRMMPFDHTSETQEQPDGESLTLNYSEQESFSSLAEQISNKELYQAFQSLTPRQQKVLQMAYVDHLTDREIALYFAVSQQAISASRRSALNKLREAINQKENEEVIRKE